MLKRLRYISSALTASILHLSLHCLSQGVSYDSLLSLLSGISGGILGNMLDALEPKQLRKLIRGIRLQDLGQSLGPLLLDACQDALEYTLLAYQAKSDEHKQNRKAKKYIRQLQNAIRQQDAFELARLQDGELYQQLQSSLPIQALEQQLKSFIPDQELRQFIAQEYPRYIQLCFTERLQSERYREAWIAYQKLMFEDFARLLRSIKEEQVQIAKALRRQPAMYQLMPSLDTFSSALSQELNIRLIALQDLHQDGLKLAQTTHSLLRDFRMRWLHDKHKTRVWIKSAIGLSLLLLMGLSTLIYLRSERPFSQKVQLVGWLGEEHKPLRGTGVIIIQLGGLSFRASINQEAEAIFTNLPSNLEGKLAKVYLSGTGSTPYYTRDRQLRLTARANQKLNISIEGIDWAKGLILDSQSLEPIEHANIYIRGIHSQTNHLGEFTCSIPINLQSKEQEIIITKEGYHSYRARHSMIGHGTLHFLLDPKAKQR